MPGRGGEGVGAAGASMCRRFPRDLRRRRHAHGAHVEQARKRSLFGCGNDALERMYPVAVFMLENARAFFKVFSTRTAADRREKLSFLSGLVGDSKDPVVTDALLVRNLQVDRRDIAKARDIRGVTTDPEQRAPRARGALSTGRCHLAQTPVLIHGRERTFRPQILGRLHARLDEHAAREY